MRQRDSETFQLKQSEQIVTRRCFVSSHWGAAAAAVDAARGGKFGSKVGQIGPQIGQILDFFRSDFSTFGAGRQMH